MILRKGYAERIWEVRYKINGFEYALYIRGTEPEMQDYLDSEMDFVGRYHALSDKEIDMVKALKIPIYLAPNL